MKKKSTRPRTAAQVESEKRREEADRLGKISPVRHTKESAAALAKLHRRFDDKSAPEIVRIALIALAAKGNR